MTDDRFSNLLTVLTVVTTLAAGIVGFLLADVSSEGGDAVGRAEQAGLDAARSQEDALDSLALDLERFVQAEEEEGRAANAFQRAVFAKGTTAEELFAEGERWTKVALRTRELTPLSRDELETDPLFPNRYQAQRNHEAERLLAVQDAENELAGRWGEKGAAYTAVLTIFAVALYLFGLALSLGSEARALFAGVAAALLTIGIVWSGVATATRPGSISDEAAEAFADGMVSVTGASGPNEYATAVDHFTRALEERSSFALAHSERAFARSGAALPQSSLTIGLLPRDVASAVYEDLQGALDDGFETASVQRGMGGAAFILGVHDDDAEMFELALEHTERAIELNPDHDLLYFIRAASLLALGETQEARTAYEDALQRTLFRENGDPRNYEEFSVSSVIEGAMTDLDTLARNGEEYREAAQEMKELIVFETFGGTPESDVTVEGASAVLLPTLAETTVASVENFDPDRDKVAIYWYYDHQELGWSVVPTISTEYLFNEGDASDVRFPVQYFSKLGCLQSGDYRMEMYVNGQLAETHELTADTGDLVGSPRPEFATWMCRPAEWKPTKATTAGFGTGYESPSGDRGVLLFRLFEGAEKFSPKRRAAILLGAVLGTALEQTTGLENDFYREAESDYFMGLSDTSVQQYLYEGGEIYAGAGIHEGAVLIGIVYGPTEWMASEEPYDIYNSLQPYN